MFKKLATFIACAMTANLLLISNATATTVLTDFTTGTDTTGYQISDGVVSPNLGADMTARITASSNGTADTPVKTQEFVSKDKAGPSMALKADASNLWGVGGYWQVAFTATGYNDITVNALLCASNKAPGAYQMSYRLGEVGNFTNVGSELVIPADSEKNNSFQPMERTLPTDANSFSGRVYVRISFSSNTSPGGKDAPQGSSSGTVYLQRLTITGEPASGKVVAPLFDVNDGAFLAVDDTISISCATTAAILKYEIYVGATTDGTLLQSEATYNNAFAPFNGVTDLKNNRLVTVKAWAEKDGLTSSDAVTATYNWLGERLAIFNYSAAPKIINGVVKATGGSYQNAQLTASPNSEQRLFVPQFDNSAIKMAPDDSYMWGEGGYWQICLPTAGFENLTFSNEQYSTSQGPKSFRLQYSLDGSQFTNIDTNNVEPPSMLALHYNRKQLPAAVNNQPMVYLRLSIHENRTYNNLADLYDSSKGNSYINNILISGEPLNTAGMPYPEKSDKTFSYDEQINLISPTQDANIRYNIYKGVGIGGTKVVSDSTDPIFLTQLPTFNELTEREYTIEAWSQKSGLSDSLKAVYTFKYRGGKVAEFDFDSVIDSTKLNATYGYGELEMYPNEKGVPLTLTSDSNYRAIRAAHIQDNTWAIGGYWKIKLSTLGYTELKFSAMQYSSNKGARDFSLLYSTDDSSYTPITNTQIRTIDELSQSYLNVELPLQASNQAELYLKIKIAGRETLDETEFSSFVGATQITGHTDINNIELYGISIANVSRPILSVDTAQLTLADIITVTQTQTAGTTYYKVRKDSGELLADKTAYSDGINPFATLWDGQEGDKVVVEVWTEYGGESSQSVLGVYTLKLYEVMSAINYLDGEADSSQLSYTSNSGEKAATLQFIQDGVPVNIGVAAKTPINVPKQLWKMGTGPNDASCWEIVVDTRGYEGITFSALQKSTNKGPRDWMLAYRVGTEGNFSIIYNSISGAGTGTTDSYADLQTSYSDFPLPSNADNKEKVYIRVFVCSNYAANGELLLNEPDGNTSINNIVIKGKQIPQSISLVDDVYIKPPVLVGDTVNVEITNQSGESFAAFYYVGSFKGEVLVDVKAFRVDVGIGQTNSTPLDISGLNRNTGDKIRVFILTPTSIAPVASRIELSNIP